jgi:SNF2 family DNA or RNA helicase
LHINKFLDGTCRFLVANPKSAAHGLTFVNCHVMVYFSLNYSFEEYSQSRGRIMRKGQERNCVYFHLLMRGTIDEDVLAVCQKKKEKQVVAEEFMRG